REPRACDVPAAKADEIVFRARSNEYVRGVLVLPDGSERVPAVMYLHRSTETRAVALELAQDLVPAGFDVFAAGLPGFGARATEGAASDPATVKIFLRLASEEARDALVFLQQSPRIDREHICIIGASLGARVAALLASRESVARVALLVPGLA